MPACHVGGYFLKFETGLLMTIKSMKKDREIGKTIVIHRLYDCSPSMHCLCSPASAPWIIPFRCGHRQTRSPVRRRLTSLNYAKTGVGPHRIIEEWSRSVYGSILCQSVLKDLYLFCAQSFIMARLLYKDSGIGIIRFSFGGFIQIKSQERWA